jgi:hypothetical protein
VLILGGERTGEFVDVLDGAQTWVDIRTGDRHRIAKLDWSVQATQLDGTLTVTERWRLRIGVHEAIAADPASGGIVQQAISNLAMTHLMRAKAESLPLEDATVPDTPAPLFGPDGQPL